MKDAPPEASVGIACSSVARVNDFSKRLRLRRQKKKAARACGGSACGDLSLSKPHLTMRCHRHRLLLRGQSQSSVSVCVSFTNIQG